MYSVIGNAEALSSGIGHCKVLRRSRPHVIHLDNAQQLTNLLAVPCNSDTRHAA